MHFLDALLRPALKLWLDKKIYTVERLIQTCYDVYIIWVSILRGVCKTRTGYLRMADADGKMRIEKCGWKKNADNKKSKKKKTRNVDGKKNNNKIK